MDDATWFTGELAVDADTAKDQYMAHVTEMFGQELYAMQQSNWDESKVDLLVDSLEMGRRVWGDPMLVPPLTEPRCVQQQDAKAAAKNLPGCAAVTEPFTMTMTGAAAAWAEECYMRDGEEELGEVVEVYDELREGDALLCEEADELQMAETHTHTTTTTYRTAHHHHEVHRDAFTHTVASTASSANTNTTTTAAVTVTSSHEEELSVLRGEKVFLEYRTAELQEQLSDLKASQQNSSGCGAACAEQADRDRAAIEQLQADLADYRRELDAARMDMEAVAEEKRAVEEKLRSTEAVFTERKRNFDHIITIFGEEKKSIVDSKTELEQKLKDITAELESTKKQVATAPPLEATGPPAGMLEAQAKELQTYKSRVEELETMLGQSGLARQSLEKRTADLEEQVGGVEARYREEIAALRETVAQKAEDIRLKTKEISDLKSYVGRKSVQWEQFKEEATSAKRTLEEKFDKRCAELDALQAVLEQHKEDAKSLKQTVAEKGEELELFRNTSSHHAGELMSLLEDKEMKIEELTKQVDALHARSPPPASEMSMTPQEIQQVLNRNKTLEDEVVGLKSLVFKLEQRSGRSAVSSSHSHAHGHHYNAGHPRTVSPSQRSFSSGRMGGGAAGLRFPSPSKAHHGHCASPTAAHTRSGSSRKHALNMSVGGGGAPGSRGVSPVGARRSTTPRGVSPISSRRNSVQPRSTGGGMGGISIRAGGSPMRKVGSSGSLFSGLTPASIRFPPGMHVRKPSNSTTPLANRSVNLGEL